MPVAVPAAASTTSVIAVASSTLTIPSVARANPVTAVAASGPATSSSITSTKAVPSATIVATTFCTVAVLSTILTVAATATRVAARTAVATSCTPISNIMEYNSERGSCVACACCQHLRDGLSPHVLVCHAALLVQMFCSDRSPHWCARHSMGQKDARTFRGSNFCVRERFDKPDGNQSEQHDEPKSGVGAYDF